MAWRHPLESLVKLLRPNYPFDPMGKVFDETLVELVKDVGGNEGVDVGVWQVVPKGLKNTGNAVLLEYGIEGGSAFGQRKRIL